MKFVNLALVAIFILLRTYLDAWMRGLDIWLAYGLEGSICLLFLLINHQTIQHRFHIKRSYGVHVLASIAVGTLIAYLGARTARTVPFDFTQPTLWLQLVIIAPLLEEALFRLVIWNSLGAFVRRTSLLITITATLFSLSHFAAYFYVPEEFKGFVIYQSIYTLFLGLYWGAARRQTGSWLAPVVLHFLVNLSFGASHYAFARFDLLPAAQLARPTTRILIVDMPIGDLAAYKDIKSPAPIYSIVDPTLDAPAASVEATCGNTTKNISPLTIRSHGYHVLGIVQEGLAHSEIYTLGANPPPGEAGIKDPAAYIDSHIRTDFTRIQESILEISPAIVLIATSETFDENFRDLKAAGSSDAQATTHANDILRAWSEVWADLVTSNPDVEFVVPAGNGGIDGLGDDVQNGQVVPAAMMAANLTKVASLNKNNCLSTFSNFNPQLVDVAVTGELDSSWSACPEVKFIELSGTSQAAARFANRLAKAMEAGESKQDFLETNLVVPEGCLADKIKLGSILN